MTIPLTRATAALALGALLVTGTACGAAAEKVGERAAERAIEAQGGGDVDLDLDDGGFSIETDEGSASMDVDGNLRVDTEDGSFTAGSGEVPAGWPDDVGFPAGLEVLAGFEQTSGEEATANITATVPGSAAEAVAFYEDALSGWTGENETSFSGGGTESRSVTFVLDDRRLDLVANDAGDGTSQVTLTHTVAGG